MALTASFGVLLRCAATGGTGFARRVGLLAGGLVMTGLFVARRSRVAGVTVFVTLATGLDVLLVAATLRAALVACLLAVGRRLIAVGSVLVRSVVAVLFGVHEISPKFKGNAALSDDGDAEGHHATDGGARV